MSRIAKAAQARADKSANPDGGLVTKTLTRAKRQENQRWSFGFRYFREIKNFGLQADKIEKKWPLSLLYRLGELSNLTLDSVLESRAVQEGTLRIHDINWKQRNIPIQRDDIDWIGEEYKANPEEFPLFQISVSKAEGRFVGFLDEANVFQVVLLDPLHNAQPSKFNDYTVQLCHPLGCEITTIKYQANVALKKIEGRGCGCAAEISAAMNWTKRMPGAAVVIPVLTGSAIEDADDLIQKGQAKSYAHIFEEGLVALVK